MAKPSAISRFLSKKSIFDVDFAIILMSNSCHTCLSDRKLSGCGQNQCHDDLRSTRHIICIHERCEANCSETHNTCKTVRDGMSVQKKC